MEYLIQPWAHQLQAIERARALRDFALLFEMGTGKTGATINILREKYAHNKALMRTLILGPVIVVKNWQDEFKMHSKISPHLVVPLTGSGKRRATTFRECASQGGSLTAPRIFVTNYEAMEMDDLFSLICEWKPEILVCDESQRLKNHKSVRAKKVSVIADMTKHNYILTGTPILNSGMDIFQQYRILDRGMSFSTTDRKTGKRVPLNFYEFRGIYFDDLNKGMPSAKHFPKFVARQDTYADLNEKIYRKAMRVLKKDCLDLPPLVKQKVHVQLGPDQARIYQEMRDEYIAWIKAHEHSPEPKAVVAQIALTKALRLQQIASGFAKTEDGQEIKINDNPRLETLRELLGDLTPAHKVIVWATFHDNYRQIAEVCQKERIGYVELHGGITTVEKNKNMDRFRKDRDCRVIIANQAAAGIGVNLVEASYSIFYSRNFSLEQDLQAESRNYRGGSEIHQKVTRIDLIADDTIDELIAEALANKTNIAESILGWEEKL